MPNIANSQKNLIYYSPVQLPKNLNSTFIGTFDIKLLAQDLSDLLSQASGQNFQIQPYSGQSKGIFLLLDTALNLNTNETAILEINNNSVTIRAKYLTGISYGMYSWLNDLGFKFYLPGIEWNIIPEIKNLYQPIKKVYQPYFKLRTFTSSGRLYPVKGLDENLTVLNEWFKWFRRNRMGSDYLGIDGHKGELFNVTYKDSLEKDSLMLAPVNGKRQFSVNAKLDPTNKKAVSLFINWALESAKSEKQKSSNLLPYKKYTSVDLGDGLNYCHTPECKKKFGSVSNQMISIANEAAIKIKNIDPRAGVSTLAYTERADTPTIKIEPNVHVMVVPSAFQGVTTPSDLMLRWSKKTSNVSMYDYLNIGVWNYDMPFFNLKEYFNFLKYLKDLKIEGVAYETSYSKFGAGIQQYFILRYLCEPYSNPEELLNSFCVEMFGNASEPIKEIFKEWYFVDVHLKTNFDNPSFYPDELGRFISKIIEAESTPGLTPDQHARIYEIKAFVVYLCKYYELYQDPVLKLSFINNPKLKQKKADDLLDYTWTLYNKMIFQNSQLSDLIKSLSPNSYKWDYKKSTEFSKYLNPGYRIINSEFDVVKKVYLPYSVNLQPFDSATFINLSELSADSIRIETIDEQAFPKFVYALPFYCNAPGVLKIKYKVGFSKMPLDQNQSLISVESEDYSFIENKFLTRQDGEGIFNFNIPEKGYYRLNIGRFNPAKIELIIYPKSNLFYLNKKSILTNALSLQEKPNSPYSNSSIYFLAPKNNKVVAMPLKANTRLTYSFFANTKIPLKPDLKLYPKLISIPFKDENIKLISYQNEVDRWQLWFMNIQPYFFFLK